MLNQLIEEGKGLSNVLNKTPYATKDVEFETWYCKSIIYLERKHRSSHLAQKAFKLFSADNSISTHDTHTLMLGTLKALRDYDQLGQNESEGDAMND